jgi:GNAT superfamily N-acetyltransferase
MTRPGPRDASIIREASVDDAVGLVPLLEQLGYPSNADQIRRRLERLLSDPASNVLVASYDERLIGLAALHVFPLLEQDRPVGQLIALAVDKAWRRQGIGRALVSAAERAAREHGCSALLLNSGDRRSDAHDFYSRLGFRVTGRRFVKNLDEVRLV